MVIAWPDPTATVCTLYPVSCSKSGIITSSNPESWVLVVVARIRFGLAGVGKAVGAAVETGVKTWVGAVVGVVADPQAEITKASRAKTDNTRNEQRMGFMQILS